MARFSWLASSFAVASLMLATAALAADDFDVCVNESGTVAIDACTRVIMKGTKRGQVIEAYRNRGVEWYFKKDYDHAIADATAAIKMQADHSPSYYLRYKAWQQKGDEDKSLADLEAAIRTDFNPEAYAARGEYKEKKGDVAGALADYKAALEKKKQKWDYIGQDKYIEEAREALKRLSAQ